MHGHLPANRLGRWLAGVIVAALATFDAQAQLAGTKTIPGSYATLAAAIADLNAQGVGAGGVTFTIAAGYTETAANLLITASGTAANPIVFQKSGTGANPEITAAAGTGALDAIIGFSGADYVTLDGLSLVENAANATATTRMEFGIALFRPSPTDGCQFNTIRNCQVTLNKANTGTFGVYGAATTAASATAVAATAPSGANTGNKLNGNTISNAVSGIYLTGSAATTTANYDLNNEIGLTAGNTVTNFGGASTSGWGIGVNMQNGAKIANNTVNSAGGTTGTATLRGIYANTGVSSSIDITGNTITLVGGAALSNVIGIDNGIGSTAAGNTVNITGNTVQNSTYATATSGGFYGIQNTASAATVNLTGNTISGNSSSATTGHFMALRNTAAVGTLNISTNIITNNTLAGAGEYDAVYTSGATSTALVVSGNQFSSTAAVATTGSLYFLNIGATSTGTMAVQNNVFGSFTKTGVGGTVYGYYNSASPQVPQTISGNTISGITLSGATGFYGLYVNTSGNQTQTITGNTVSNVAGGTTFICGLFIGYGSAASTINTNTVTGLSAAASVYGLFLGSSVVGGTIYANTIGGLSGAGSGSAVVGLYTSAFAPAIYGNKVYDLADSHATGLVFGLCVQPGILPGSTVAFYNNLVGDLRAPAATSLNAVVGLYINSGAASISAYYNTFYLAASSTGATFGTSGIYLGAPLTVFDARNNIVVNKSTAAGAGGYTAALRRLSGAPGFPPDNLAATANNNLYYAGPPSATNVIYVEGTTAAAINAQPTLAAYRAFMAPRESNAVTEDLAFASTAGAAATFLHVSPAAPTQAEGGGTPIGSITTDFDGDARSASTPDIGADEGPFLPLDLTGPSFTLAALANTSNTATRSLAVAITDPSGISATTLPRLFYRKGTSGAFVSVPAASQSGSTYTFAFDYAAVGGVAVADVVQYYVVAQDALGNVSSNPLGGTFTAAPARPYQYTILGALSGVYYVGSGTSPNPARTYATLTAAAAAYNGNGLTGAVTFLLLDATYSAAETFPVVFSNNPEASATNTLTIRPTAGVSSTITAASSLLAFSNARYVTLDGSNSGTTSRDLTLTSTTNVSNSSHVLVESPSTNALGTTNITVRNLNIVGRSPVAAGGGLFGIAAFGPDNDNLTVQNNSVVGVTTGIFLSGNALVSAGGNDNTVVQDNIVGPATASAANNIGITGLGVSNAVNITVTGNVVQNVSGGGPPVGLSVGGVTGGLVRGNTVRGVTSITPGYAYGLNVSTGTTGLIVDANRISGVTGAGAAGYGGYGIWVYTGVANSNVRISNNFVSDIQGTSSTGLTSGATVGILLTTTMSGVSVQYNSVNLTGTYNYAGGFSTAFGVEASVTGLNVQNNIFANAQVNGTGTTGSAYAFYSSAPAAAYTALNNNDYYSSGPQAAIAYFGGAPQATLAALRTATGKDANSVSTDPIFASATDLHTAAPALNAAATPIAGITTDLDGDLRDATTPDIGADEFAPIARDLAAVALLAPATTSTCYGTAEPVSVSIRNAGSAALNFATTAATITVVVTLPGGGTQTLAATLNTGTLANGASQTVTLPATLDMSAAGTYTFAITATAAGDGNPSNDLLAPAPTRTVVAPVAGALAPAAAAICVSGTATLTLAGAAGGSIQYQSSADNLTFTDIAGATSASYTTPVLTATTYYRAQVRCNSGTATSNVATVTVNNPSVASTNSPVASCAGSPATLTATGSVGASVRFFSTATGGTALATTAASSYTTPALTANTTYYAEAYVGSSAVAGLTSNSATNGTFVQASLTDYPVGFATTQAGTLASVDVYPSAAGPLTLRLYSVSGGQPAGTATAVAGSDVTITVTAAQVGTRVSVPLNYNLAAGEYKLSNLVGALGRFSSYSGTYPLASANGVLVVRGSYASYTSTSYATTTYNGFFNLTYNTECVGATRTAVQVNVTQPAAATFSYPATGLNCAGATSMVTPTLATGATAGTFSSTTGLMLNATTGVVSLVSSAAGTYTVTNTVAASGACGASFATATITINPSPARPTLTPSYNGTQTTLTSSAATGNQFYYNGTFIAGATGQSYVVNGSASTYGAYTVVVTNAFGCSSQASVATVVTGTKGSLAGASVALFPNPTPDGRVRLEASGLRAATQLEVLDALGRLVSSELVPASSGPVVRWLDLTGQPAGVYLLRLRNEQGVDMRRLVRE